jgi:hypothetical protein
VKVDRIGNLRKQNSTLSKTKNGPR